MNSIEVSDRVIEVSKSINNQFCIEINGELSKRQKKALFLAVVNRCKGFDGVEVINESSNTIKGE